MSDSSAHNPARSPAQAKRALLDGGLEIFRTRGDEIVLAERPRENLIMDSGVRLKVGDPAEVRVVFRAQKSDYASDDEPVLFDRVRKRAAAVLPAGFVEIDARTTRVADPGDGDRTLDIFFEVTFARALASFDQAVTELKAALALDKRV